MKSQSKNQKLWKSKAKNGYTKSAASFAVIRSLYERAYHCKVVSSTVGQFARPAFLQKPYQSMTYSKA